MSVYVCVELKGLGADFVFGFVQSMDGERDPRNLLLAFQVAKSIIHRGYDLGESTRMQRLSPQFFFPLILFEFFASHNLPTDEAQRCFASHSFPVCFFFR